MKWHFFEDFAIVVSFMKTTFDQIKCIKKGEVTTLLLPLTDLIILIKNKLV